jgi:23S rRNA pseudouridine1911/1915/1917 synthase
MPLTSKTARVTEDQSGRVDRVVQSLTNLSHSKMRGLFDHGCVTINGRPCDHGGQSVKPGDQVEVRYDPHQGYREKRKKWDDRTFTIVHEDDAIIVVNKAAGVLTVATDHGERITLENRVSHYLKSTSRQREAFVAHRLDRGVSGLLVFAKSPLILKRLQDQFRDRKPERLYIAIVAGHLRAPAGTFRSYLDTGDNLDRFSTPDDEQGQLAITHYRLQQQLSDTTVVEVRLETGRRNQIRVHFADHGHPVLGDPRYGRRNSQHDRWPKNRLALHALSLGLEHPTTGEPMLFESDLPKSMRLFIAKS